MAASKLSKLTIFGYGLGHVCNDICASMWFTYLLLFFQKVFAISIKTIKTLYANKCGSSNFHPGEGPSPSRGLLRDCTSSNFAKVRLKLYL